jgi:tRNA dimethylallyltransferase
MLPEFPPVVAILGPTAVGKSRLAMRLARELDGEIVSADSRQVYRYMDIGTDKPIWRDQMEVRHHMIDVASPDDTYSAQRFAEEGRRILRRLAAKQRLALVVGGTGFYVRALLDGIELPRVPPDPEIRETLRREAAELGPQELHRRLAERDPASAARIHSRNLPRVIRALEITERTGRPVPPLSAADTVPALYIGLLRDRRELWKIADRRALDQLRAGLPEETRLLLAMGYSPDLPSMQGFGYRQMVAYLKGEVLLTEALAQYRAAQHKYIRRQMTWFRADERIVWFDAGSNAEESAQRLARDWLRSRGQLSDREDGL